MIHKDGGGIPGLRLVPALLGALALLLTSAPTAMAQHGGPPGVSVDTTAREITYRARADEWNSVVVTETATDYVFTESGTLADQATAIPPIADNTGGVCDVADLGGSQQVTCPKAGIDRISVYAGSEAVPEFLEFLAQDNVTIDANPPQGAFVDGEGGNDNIFGSPGPDVLLGGPDIDQIEGRAGGDLIDSGLAIDDPNDERVEEVFGGSGLDTATHANRGSAITMDFASSNQIRDADGLLDDVTVERVVGTHHNDQMIGGIRADTIVGNGGNDTLCGGLGVDTVDYSEVDVYASTVPPEARGVEVDLAGTLPTDPRHTLDVTVGNNFIEFRKARRDCREIVETTGLPKPGPDALRDCTPNDGVPGVEVDCVGEDVENIIGTPYDDVLTGNDPDEFEGQGPRVEPHGVNDIDGRGGNDLIDGGFGPDSLSGGDGSGDTVTYPSRAQSVSATIDGESNDGTDTWNRSDPFDRNFLVGDYDPRTDLGDSINGDVENLIGGPQGDFLRGDESRNVIDGGDGPDTIEGGRGDDVLRGAGGDDFLDGQQGNDDVGGEEGGDNVIGGDGADVMSGGAGTDTVDYSDALTPVFVTLDGVGDDGRRHEGDNALSDLEGAVGGIEADVLIGSAGSGRIDGGDGGDTLDGGGGSDELVGGSGVDLVTYASRGASVFVSLAEPGNDGEAGEQDAIREVEKVSGGFGDDTLFGDGGNNVLIGGPGNDRVAGAEGDDMLGGSEGADTLSGDVGGDTLFGSDGKDTLSGGDGNDDLKGEAGDDSLDGGRGSDRLNGGPHVDTVLYASRTAGVTAKLDGEDRNGERNENDFINADVESVTTGRGGDTIDADDNQRGEVRCGAGRDLATIDPDDRVNADCEIVQVPGGTRCSAQGGTARMSRSGAIRLRVFCPIAARGTLRLESATRVRSGKRRRVLQVGSRRFSLKTGQRKTISVRTTKAARRMILRKKRLSVRVRVLSRGVSQKSRVRASRVLTVKAPK